MLPGRMGFGMTLETLALGLIDSIIGPFWSALSQKLLELLLNNRPKVFGHGFSRINTDYTKIKDKIREIRVHPCPISY
jgi:hypothetical protein